MTINQLARGMRLAREVARWATVGNGALTFGVTSAMVFCRSREGLSSPDLQLLFTPASYAQGVFRQLEREPGMTVAVCPVRPESRGTIMAQSPDPLTVPGDPPELSVGAQRSARADRRRAHTRQIFGQPAMAQYSVEETVPGPGVATDEQFGEFARKPAPTSSTRSAPARWAPTRWRSSTRACGSTASRACGSSTPR